MGYNSFTSSQWNVAMKVRCSQKLIMYKGNHFYQCIVLCLINQRWSLSPRPKALTIVPSLRKNQGQNYLSMLYALKWMVQIPLWENFFVIRKLYVTWTQTPILYEGIAFENTPIVLPTIHHHDHNHPRKGQGEMYISFIDLFLIK